MDRQPSNWAPIGATYVGDIPEFDRRWTVLFARYGEDGWEFAEQLLDRRDVPIHSARGETAAPPDRID